MAFLCVYFCGAPFAWYWGYAAWSDVSALVSTCGDTACGFDTLRVRVCLEFVLIDSLSHSRAPGPSGDRGVCPSWLHGADGGVCRLLFAVYQMLSLGPCTVAARGAPSHNRWGVVERRLPVKTQGRNADCGLTSRHQVLLQGGFKCQRLAQRRAKSQRRRTGDCGGLGGHGSAPGGALSPRKMGHGEKDGPARDAF